MKRRDFIRTSALGAAFLQFNYMYGIEPRLEKYKGGKYCLMPEGKLPVIDDVDVIVAGSTMGSIAASIEAKRNGASVFMVGYLPYMGEDVCGNFKHFFDEKTGYHSLLNKVFPGQNESTPFHAKKTLEHELIDNKINFLYSSYVTDVLFDEMMQPAGVIIANRNGRQIVLGKVIIDATHNASVGQLAGIKLSGGDAEKEHTFQFITVGNSTSPNARLNLRVLPISPSRGNQKFNTNEYTFKYKVKDWSFESLSDIEQRIRTKVWDPDQLDSADRLFYIPPFKIAGKTPYKHGELNLGNFSVDACQPKNRKGIYILGACADVPRTTAEEILTPYNSILVGEILGKSAAKEAQSVSRSGKVDIKPVKGVDNLRGVVGQVSEIMRPGLGGKSVAIGGTSLPVVGEYEIVVMGGGTAGANAGISASRHGAKTLVLEYLHALGGTQTSGMIGRYWDGYREGFTKEIDQGVKQMAPFGHPRQKTPSGMEWNFDWKIEWYRKEIRNAGGDIWFGVLGCGAFVDNGKVKGVVIATPDGMGVVLSKIVIDSSGSADIAIAAGAGYNYTDEKTFSIQGSGLPPINLGDHYNNTDWTFTDDNDVFDITRLQISGKAKFDNFYDIGKLSQTRERKRVIGDYEVSVLDVYNKRRYPDTISFHESSFDTHSYTIDPFFTIKPPAERNKIYDTDLPLRSLLPKGLDNILVTGLGASAHRDAMPIIRMQPCLQNQGYSVGYLSCFAIKENTSIREVDIKKIQKYLVEKNILPERVLTDKDNFPYPDEAFQDALTKIHDNFKGLEVLMTDVEKSKPLLKKALSSTNVESEKVNYAHILCMVGDNTGIQHVIDAVDSYEAWDEGWNFTGMGQFGRCMSKLDSLIMALGETGNQVALPTVIKKAELLTPNHYFSHFRAIALAFEGLKSNKAVPVLSKLLDMEGISGHHVTTYEKARQAVNGNRNDVIFRNNVLREIHIARALYRCGDNETGQGKEIMENYANDLHGHYFRHAHLVLLKG
jgi:hypothetical protein